jgi:tetratricopeptide (TPR) repeat protein
VEPRLPDDARATDLDREMRAELRTLSAVNAETVARYLVQVGRLLDVDPELAYANAMAAQRRAGRVAVVREVTGLAAYRTGRYAEALAELRAAKRLSGSVHLLPMIADAERGLGRPERALELAAGAEAKRLSTAERVEMTIVVSGARRDLGQLDAAVVALQTPELKQERSPWWPRLAYAYADALDAAGRSEEARGWLARAAAADVDGETDAADRLAELEGIGEVVDLDSDLDSDPESGGSTH